MDQFEEYIKTEVEITKNELNFDFKMPQDEIKCKEEFENSDKIMLQTGECIKTADDDVGTQRNNENMLDNSLYNFNIKAEEINIKEEINESDDEQELHLLIHTPEKNFKCKICEKSFIRKSNLNKHLLIHSGEKNFMCNICEKSFARKDVLKTHLKCHSAEKNFKCNICEKPFTQKSYLSKHLIIHSSEKNFKCNICDKLFTRKGDLNKHLLTHSNEKNFKCDNCKKTYTRRSDLNRHLVIHLKKNKIIFI